MLRLDGETLEFQSTPPVWGATVLDALPTAYFVFQSTPPVWGATQYLDMFVMQYLLFQSTPPVWGATYYDLPQKLSSYISIHAPRVGGDAISLNFSKFHCISIHAPRVGGDQGLSPPCQPFGHFNPRPPCGGRLYLSGDRCLPRKFQSTPPVWGATAKTAKNSSCSREK